MTPRITGKGRADYVTVKLPKGLADLIDEVIESGRFGYRTRGEFVSEAVRRLLKELGYLPVPEK